MQSAIYNNLFGGGCVAALSRYAHAARSGGHVYWSEASARHASACHRLSRPGSIGEGARFLNRQLSNRLFGKTGGLSQLFDFLSLLQYKVHARP